MKKRGNVQQVSEIARFESRLIEGLVVKVFIPTRTALVRIDGSNQQTMVNLGHVDPYLVANTNSRLLLYRSRQALYAISVMQGQYAPSSAGVTLGDRWGSTEFAIYSSRTYGSQSYDVAGIDSLGRIRGSYVTCTGITCNGNMGGWLPFTTKDYLPSAITASPANIFSCTIPYPMTIKSWAQAYYVVTTNDGSNYWTIALMENDLTPIVSIDTSADSADVWCNNQEHDIDHGATVSDIAVIVRVTKTGSPGVLYLNGPTVYVI